MNRQVCAWHNRDTSPGDFTLVRLYEDGTFTAERNVDGVYTGEVELVAEAVSSLAEAVA